MRRVAEEGIRLLDHMGQHQLAGDLAEELHGTRSSAWVVAQVLAAGVDAAAQAVRSRPYLAFRAATVAWITLQVVNGQWPFAPHPEVTGWVVRSAGGPFVMIAQYAACGWVVARFHRQNPLPLVIASTGVLTLTNALFVVLRRLSMMRFQPWSAIDLVAMPLLLLLPLMTIAGGLWGSDFWHAKDRDSGVTAGR